VKRPTTRREDFRSSPSPITMKSRTSGSSDRPSSTFHALASHDLHQRIAQAPQMLQGSLCRAHDGWPAPNQSASGPMERLMMIWDEMDDLAAFAPRVLAGLAAIGLIVTAAFINHLWPI
jgi:hypothetical protein